MQVILVVESAEALDMIRRVVAEDANLPLGPLSAKFRVVNGSSVEVLVWRDDNGDIVIPDDLKD